MTQPPRQSPLPFSAFISHLHPRTIPADTLRYRLSFGLGGMAATLLALLFLTGILQLLSYTPKIEAAYNSILQMYGSGNPAGFIRNCHYWAGNLLVIVAFLHLLRVFLTGALTGARRYNWLVGVALFVLVLFANFTGYLMPWDQLAYWAVTIFTSMLSYVPGAGDSLTSLLRGGKEVGAETLSTFYALHIGLIPALLVLLIFYHFWLVRKAGGLIRMVGDMRESPGRLPAIPHLLAREAAVGFSLLAVVLFFAALIDAPLADEANPGQSPNPAKAAWYFMGLQELLLHLHPSFAICVVPLLMLLSVLVLPFIANGVLPGAVWFGGRRGAWIAAASTLVGVGASVLAVLIDNMFLGHGSSPQSTWLLRGLLPVAAAVFALALFFLLLRTKWTATTAEALMGVVLLVVSSAITLTMVGLWLRGPGMALVWPWAIGNTL